MKIKNKYFFRWLGDVAVFRYDHFYGTLNGTPQFIRFESGSNQSKTYLPMDGIIQEHLQDEMHVWIILKGIFYK